MKLGKYFGGICGFFLIMLLVGCATTRVAIKPEYQAKLHSAEILVCVPQSEIYIKAESSPLVYGPGLAGDLMRLADAVDGYFKGKTAEEIAESIRENLVEYYFRSDLMNALESYGYEVDWLRDRKVEYVGSIYSDGIRERLSKTDSALVKLQTRYYVTPDYNNLKVESEISVFMPGKSGTKPIYKNTFYYQEPVHETADTGTQKIERMSNNIRGALSRSHNQIIAMFEYDVQRLEGGKKEVNKDIKTEGDITWTRYGGAALLAVKSGKQEEPTGRLGSPHHDQKPITSATTLSQNLVFGVRSVVNKRQYVGGFQIGLLKDRNLEGWLPSALISLSEGALKIVPYEPSTQNPDYIIDVEIIKAYFLRHGGLNKDIATLALRVTVKDEDRIILDKIYRERDKISNMTRWIVSEEYIETGFTNAVKGIINSLQRDLFPNSER